MQTKIPHAPESGTASLNGLDHTEITRQTEALPATMPNGSNWPRISIVTPNFNYGRYLERTVRSVLSQNYPYLEYIVQDGGSTDESVEILKTFESQSLRWVQQTDLGQYDAINRGMSMATGEILGWLNSDDVHMPWTLRAVAEMFGQFPQMQWLMGSPSQIQDDVVHNVGAARPLPREFIAAGMYNCDQLGWIQQESCFWRRSLWEAAGPLNTHYRFAADFELWTRFANHSDLSITSTLLGGFSVWKGNRSRNNHDRYMGEVREAVSKLPENIRKSRAAICKDMAYFEKVRHITGLRGLVRRWRNLSRYAGPTIRRNVDLATYEQRTVNWFD